MEAEVPKTTLRAKGQVTLPDEIRKAAHLEEGDPLEVEMTSEGILLRPLKAIDASQVWFWTPEWQAGEREASAQLAGGRGNRYPSGQTFLRDLKARRKR